MTAYCIIPNCRNRAPATDAFCSEHRTRPTDALTEMQTGSAIDTPRCSESQTNRNTDALKAENQRLRTSLEKIATWKRRHLRGVGGRMVDVTGFDLQEIARAALKATKEDV